MILRLIVLIILVVGSSDKFFTLYLLLVSCSLMMLAHAAVRPYVSDVINLFDSYMLVTIMLVISLLIIETYRGL